MKDKLILLDIFYKYAHCTRNLSENIRKSVRKSWKMQDFFLIWLIYFSMFILNFLIFYLHFYIFELISSLFVNLKYKINYIWFKDMSSHVLWPMTCLNQMAYQNFTSFLIYLGHNLQLFSFACFWDYLVLVIALIMKVAVLLFSNAIKIILMIIFFRFIQQCILCPELEW